MKRSPAQIAAWERRFLLGTLVSTSRWILSKLRVIESSGLPDTQKERLRDKIHDLSAELENAARQAGWTPKV